MSAVEGKAGKLCGNCFCSQVEEGHWEGGGSQLVGPTQPLLSPPPLRSDYHRGVFCYGDTKGNIIIFTSDNVTHGLFNPRILPRTSKWGS